VCGDTNRDYNLYPPRLICPKGHKIHQADLANPHRSIYGSHYNRLTTNDIENILTLRIIREMARGSRSMREGLDDLNMALAKCKGYVDNIGEFLYTHSRDTNNLNLRTILISFCPAKLCPICTNQVISHDRAVYFGTVKMGFGNFRVLQNYLLRIYKTNEDLVEYLNKSTKN
jgi:hypothetical protein